MLRERAKTKLAQEPNKRKLLKDEKMKKTIAILLVLVIAMAGVWAATSADLQIKTSISDITVIGVTTSSGTPTWESIGDLTGDDAIGVDNTNTLESPIAYLHARSNSKGFKVFLKSATALTTTDVATTINYSIKMTQSGSSTPVTYTTGTTITEGSEPLAISITGATAITETYASLAVAVDSTDWANALVADTYSSTMTFEYKAN